MLLSHETTITFDQDEANIVGHMCYAAYKLWNVCNYERNHYKEAGLEKYPDWYYQKSKHKDDLWFRSLPSQTAQEVCKLLDKSWRSFYQLKKSGSIEDPRPPRYKKDKMPITYMQNGIRHEKGSMYVRLSLSKQLKEYMKQTYGISAVYLYLKNPVFSNTDMVKQIKIYPPAGDGKSRIIVIYEIEDVQPKQDNGRYLSIDLGLHNLMTCYDNVGKTFIVGRKYLSLSYFYNKEIARVQSQWAKIQRVQGVKYPKTSKHLQKLYRKKNNCIKDYLHKMTRYITDYCVKYEIHTVVIGDIRGIRKENDLGSRINQKLHSLPYERIYMQLEYKLKMKGIRLVRQEERYSSQCPPQSQEVSRIYAEKKNRKKRGIYAVDAVIYNADAIGAYNILRKYNAVSGKRIYMPIIGLSNTTVIKVAV